MEKETYLEEIVKLKFVPIVAMYMKSNFWHYVMGINVCFFETCNRIAVKHRNRISLFTQKKFLLSEVLLRKLLYEKKNTWKLYLKVILGITFLYTAAI